MGGGHDWAALNAATRSRDVRAILASGASPEVVRAQDNLFLRRAAAEGHGDVVAALATLGLTGDDARARDNEALFMAVYGGHVGVIYLLRDLFGLTAADASSPRIRAWHPRAAAALRGAFGVETPPPAREVGG